MSDSKSKFSKEALGVVAAVLALITAIVTLSTEGLKFLQQQRQDSPSNGSATSPEQQQPLPSNSPGKQSEESSGDPLDTPSNSQDRASPDSPSPSSTAVNYSNLEDFLQGGEWEKADRETENLILRMANREEEGWLDYDSIKNFPCDVLSQIDRLWVESLHKIYEVSFQKAIYSENCSGESDGEQSFSLNWLLWCADVSEEKVLQILKISKRHLEEKYEDEVSKLESEVEENICHEDDEGSRQPMEDVEDEYIPIVPFPFPY